MAKYRKKPVVIEAVRNTVSLFPSDPHAFLGTFDGVRTEGPLLFIQTPESEMRADYGDWIIKGVKGEFYPCKPDIFEATYEKVEDGE